MGIVVAMVYVTYSNLSQQLHATVSYNQQVNELDAFNLTFKREMQNAYLIEKLDERSVVLIDYDQKASTYEFKDETIIRTVEKAIDTFNLKVKAVKLSHETELSDESSVKTVTLNLSVFNQDMTLLFDKEYGVANQINELFQYGS